MLNPLPSFEVRLRCQTVLESFRRQLVLTSWHHTQCIAQYLEYLSPFLCAIIVMLKVLGDIVLLEVGFHLHRTTASPEDIEEWAFLDFVTAWPKPTQESLHRLVEIDVRAVQEQNGYADEYA